MVGFGVTTHDTSDVSIVLEALMQDGIGSPGFLVLNLSVSPVSLGSTAWAPNFVNTFTTTLGGWLGSSILRTSCQPVGTLLGGRGALGAGSFLQNRFVGLPQHVGLVVRFRFVNVEYVALIDPASPFFFRSLFFFFFFFFARARTQQFLGRRGRPALR